jgi:hypothetical protein
MKQKLIMVMTVLLIVNLPIPNAARAQTLASPKQVRYLNGGTDLNRTRPPGADELMLARSRFNAEDFRGMALALKSALEATSPSSDVALAAYDLWEAGFQRDPEAMQGDFRLPSEIKSLSVTFGHLHRRPVPDEVFSLRVEVETAIRIVELRLRRAPRLTVLDANQGLGTISRSGNIVTLSNQVVTSEGESASDLSPSDLRAVAAVDLLNSSGLYELTGRLETGTTFNGWFVVAEHLASTTPVLTFPEGQVFTTPTPTLSFVNYTSPEHKPFEARNLLVTINFHPGHEPPFPNVVTKLIDDPQISSLTIGKGPLSDAGPLASGEYRFALFYRESRSFGSLTIVRESSVASCFLVDTDGSSPKCFPTPRPIDG